MRAFGPSHDSDVLNWSNLICSTTVSNSFSFFLPHPQQHILVTVSHKVESNQSRHMPRITSFMTREVALDCLGL